MTPDPDKDLGAAANGRRLRDERTGAQCPVCGAVLESGYHSCRECGWVDAARVTEPIAAATPAIRTQFDRLLVLSAVFSLASLYLPWLPGVNAPITGWNLYYSLSDMTLDELRHWQQVERPESIFLLLAVFCVAAVFSRTSRHAGLRDLVACVILVAGGGYLLIYYVKEWGWCLLYHYAGSYIAFTSLALMVAGGILRTKFMPWISQSKALLLVSSAFLMTAFFLPWSLDQNGLQLMKAARQFYWLGVPRLYAYLIVVFPVLGFAAFVGAFRPIPASANFIVRLWPLFLGLAALVYFRAMWATYLSGFPLGSWATLAGTTTLTSAGILDIWPARPAFGKAMVVVFLALSCALWIQVMRGDIMDILSQFTSVPMPIMF